MTAASLLTWTFASKASVPSDVQKTLVDGEIALHAYKTIRDIAIFTNKRLIVRDAQGITGKKNRDLLTSLLFYRYVLDRECGDDRSKL